MGNPCLAGSMSGSFTVRCGRYSSAGTPLFLERLATHLPEVQDLTARIDRLADAGVLEVDRSGWRIYSVCRITLVPTDIFIRVGKRQVYPRSLGAAIGLMEELEECGQIITRCPLCGRRLKVQIHYGKIRRIRSGLHDWRCAFRVRESIQPGFSAQGRALIMGRPRQVIPQCSDASSH